MTRFKALACVSVIVALVGLPCVSMAGFIGETVTSQYYAYGTPYDGSGSPATFVADGTIQQTFGIGFREAFNLTVRDNQIEYDLLYDGFWSISDASLNTGGLYIANGNLITCNDVVITEATVNSSTTLAGFNIGNLTFNTNGIAIDWAGFSNIRAGDKVILDVTFAGASVPEPPMLLLIGVGLAGLAGVRKKFKQ
jgi:hypothetical protein